MPIVGRGHVGGARLAGAPGMGSPLPGASVVAEASWMPDPAAEEVSVLTGVRMFACLLDQPVGE